MEDIHAKFKINEIVKIMTDPYGYCTATIICRPYFISDWRLRMYDVATDKYGSMSFYEHELKHFMSMPEYFNELKNYEIN